jgi:hypothetical protein
MVQPAEGITALEQMKSCRRFPAGLGLTAPRDHGASRRDHVADVASLRQPVDRSVDAGTHRREGFDRQSPNYVSETFSQRSRILNEREADLGNKHLHLGVLRVT